jgi:hypothetical protein
LGWRKPLGQKTQGAHEKETTESRSIKTKTAQIQLRTTKEIKTRIKEAADYLGQTIADFVRTAAVREAKIYLASRLLCLCMSQPLTKNTNGPAAMPRR